MNMPGAQPNGLHPDELSTVPLGAPGVHLREVLEDAFHEEIL